MRVSLAITLVSALAAGVLAATVAPSATASAGHPHTHRVVVRPVDRSGHPVAGWTVTRERGTSVSCGGASASAVNRNIVACFPSADYLPSCWKSRHHTVLCVRDATRHKLVRIRYTGSIGSVSAPRHPSPQDLRLTRGQKCEIRVGGAWSQLPSHPHWVGFYSCRSGNVYGPAKGDGINRSNPVWTVHMWLNGTKRHVVTRGVGTAYFVGTHR
ncbi:MAG: hypothetical protein J2P22_09285 [Nocardioides sp.]|nr:hypothetical protein [Nocardioides sp.]